MNLPTVAIPAETMEKWQSIVDVLAQAANVPAALIRRVDPPAIEVCLASRSGDNPYKAGDRAHLAGLYCEHVAKTQGKLLVPNALRDKRWRSRSGRPCGRRRSS